MNEKQSLDNKDYFSNVSFKQMVLERKEKLK